MRRVPSTLLVAVVARVVFTVARFCISGAYAPELSLAGSGVTLAYDVLVLAAMLEVRRLERAGSREWQAWPAAVPIAVDLLYLLTGTSASRADVIAAVGGIALVVYVARLPQIALASQRSERTVASKAMQATTRVAVMWTIFGVVLFMLTTIRTYELAAIRMHAMTYAFTYAMCLGLLGYALGRAASQLSQWTAAIAAWLMVWCAGVLAAQLPWIYRMFWQTSSWTDVPAARYATAFVNGLPVAVMLACALFSLSVAALGSRHGDKDLVTEARGRGIAIVLMFLASQRAVTWLAPKLGDELTYVAVMAAAAILNALAAYQLARLWDSTGRSLAEPAVPAARVVTAP
ncbi:MAG TPA: hypothetical protein VMZ53_26245 [Kofleriaceae bacterium]|nr:hypothetical protein [Kofleriaceae bacterium]